MSKKLQITGWIAVGLVSGVLFSMGFQAVAQRDTRASLPIEGLRQFADVYGAIKANYVESVEDKKLITEAISGMLTGLDPHSSYLDADAFKELQEGTQGEFGGLGLEVGTEDGFVRVVSPIEGTPAEKAGVKAGDLIIKIDEKATKGLALNDAVKLMRGKPKTSVTLTISRKGQTKPLVFTIVRDIIQIQSVRSKMLEPGFGYLRITQFQEHTVENLVKHFNQLAQQGPLNALVLDLRNDPGGLLTGAIGVSAAFLPEKVLVVSTDGRQEDAKRKYHATVNDYYRSGRDDPLAKLSPLAKTVPMVVLVNSGSASASEIVAGALQDHQRAKILGTQTFGKGSVQTILPLTSNTAIKLTTARYFTPKGQSIQAKGIAPDLWVEETADGAVVDRLRVREADLNRHLSGRDAPAKGAEPEKAKPNQKTDQRSNGDGPGKDIKPIEFGSADDYQLQQALNHLKGKPVATSARPDNG
ncbi:MAG: S41 family peptidase [Burkholderiaceae bacterium]|nr:S41 family peptidase [Burkholderiaceae bacterium]